MVTYELMSKLTAGSLRLLTKNIRLIVSEIVTHDVFGGSSFYCFKFDDVLGKVRPSCRMTAMT